MAIEQHPGDTGGSGGAGDVRQSRAADGFHDDGTGMLRSVALNNVEELLALLDGIVPGIDDFEADAEFRGSLLRGAGLFALEVVVVGDQRHQEI